MVVTTKISSEGLTAGGRGLSSCSGYGVDVDSEMVLVVMEMIVALTVFRLN